MKAKRCFRCKRVQPLASFYPHPKMRDGHLNKCRECAKRDVRVNYAMKREQYHAYERDRAQRPERRIQTRASSKRTRLRNPIKAIAWAAVGNAVRDGRLVRQPCEACGTTENVQAHHEDYEKPLDVRWLCFEHHREIGHGQHVSRRAS